MMMMPSDADLVGLCARIYRATDGWDYYDAGHDDGIAWAVKRLEGFDVVVLRGSVTLQDWLRDVQAFAVPSRIGHVHSGFYAGMEHMWADLKLMLEQPAIITGHSLGAARAAVLTALMTVDHVPPVARVVFGEPKPGLLDIAQLITAVPGRSYRNGDAAHHDLVTDLPLSFPPLQYVHPTPIIPVCCRPDESEVADLGIFAWHSVELYQAALAVQPQEKVA